ncbi:YdcH family protein [Conchiformibius kuhniae]|uniref:YdcH family protein n=1 Tax=Conchiformibius kuhniae TaxID=211502 RepID=A0A8T9MQD3_9NEIS|nr:YdcH family protein [Conchiformibius kuhniae]UOP04110.1 YdcH family protein [Conchiformibius kuhniae]
MFPEYRHLITELKNKDAHFTRLFNEHNELDDQITRLEKDPVTGSSAESEIHELKVKKLALKDELYVILKRAADEAEQ